jgi:hypothetical protein
MKQVQIERSRCQARNARRSHAEHTTGQSGIVKSLQQLTCFRPVDTAVDAPRQDLDPRVSVLPKDQAEHSFSQCITVQHRPSSRGAELRMYKYFT